MKKLVAVLIFVPTFIITMESPTEEFQNLIQGLQETDKIVSFSDIERVPWQIENALDLQTEEKYRMVASHLLTQSTNKKSKKALGNTLR